MKSVREQIGGLGNLMFKQAFILGQFLDEAIPDVYLQSEKYWIKHRDTIKKTFDWGIGQDDRVALHIRRGDYVDNSFYVDLTQTDYYIKAIAMFPNEKFLIFCADRQGRDGQDRIWCRNWAKNKGINFEMWWSESETEDMNKMASCKGIIGANSSFSWWAAFLSNAKCVFPKDWFTDGVQRTELLEEWIKI